MKVVAEVQRLHVPFIPLVDVEAVLHKVGKGTAAVVFKPGDGTEETALGFEEPGRQVPGKRSSVVLIVETGEGLV